MNKGKNEKYTSTRNAFYDFLFMFILTNISYSQYVPSDVTAHKKISLYPYTHHYGCWSERFDIQYIMTHYEQFDLIKTAMMIRGFTQNNFLGKMYHFKINRFRFTLLFGNRTADNWFIELYWSSVKFQKRWRCFTLFKRAYDNR
jgi:hypothetical protein